MEDLHSTQPEDNLPEAHDSILDKVLAENESKSFSSTRPYKIVSQIINSLKSRERDVILSRYGLASAEVLKETLEEIGKRFGVTRERVRQIESATLKKINKKYSTQLKPVLKTIAGYVDSLGGVVELEDLADYLHLNLVGAEAELERRALRLIMGAYDKISPLRKFPLFKEGWMRKELSEKLLTDIQAIAKSVLEGSRESLAEDDLIAKILIQLPTIDRALVAGVLRIDPAVSLDNHGKWGLVSWPQVKPKRIRDKIFLVLEEIGKPLHFVKIAELIKEKYSLNKPVLSRTVHNELIGDDRFVLVGRGIYALKKWGYQPGVVADVIKDVLRQAGRPLTVTELVTAVLQKRQVKKNTIIANLQNRNLFKKVAKSTYTLTDSDHLATSNTNQ
ncbi:TPA: hypothetical protein DCR79_01040 [Patescibacteria group bacterium]|uniref:Sigma-70 region 4 domain protein n=1 Tax=candidate division Kazan bacterium GW2011_GWA1_44_22 TaxID=1620410 RepID=A0A0G1I0H5_UNCK3|nr:MAG: Sigma-70 region 4 domain protein [candidate division Kazan bacterium GW2011_GWA1_44_22]HAR54863.1 hypothetical protein [Patescibacteria group bacterium]HCR42120.1 hypothetical protein [Patescibacteria group bacterium]